LDLKPFSNSKPEKVNPGGGKRKRLFLSVLVMQVLSYPILGFLENNLMSTIHGESLANQDNGLWTLCVRTIEVVTDTDSDSLDEALLSIGVKNNASSTIYVKVSNMTNPAGSLKFSKIDPARSQSWPRLGREFIFVNFGGEGPIATFMGTPARNLVVNDLR
jgi:hypothetical protein